MPRYRPRYKRTLIMVTSSQALILETTALVSYPNIQAYLVLHFLCAQLIIWLHPEVWIVAGSCGSHMRQVDALHKLPASEIRRKR